MMPQYDADKKPQPARSAKAPKESEFASSVLERSKAGADLLRAEAAANTAEAECYERKSQQTLEERREMVETERLELERRKRKDKQAVVGGNTAVADTQRLLLRWFSTDLGSVDSQYSALSSSRGARV
jgi:hypothetical protein